MAFTAFPIPTTTLELMGWPINVKDYGAVGDGVHDDTANIQAAIDAAQSLPSGLSGMVYLGPGVFLVTSTIFINAHGTSIVGSGQRSTQIRFQPSADDICFDIGAGATMLVQIALRHFSIYSTDATFTKIAIQTSDVDILEISHVMINGSGGWRGGAGSIGFRTMGRDIGSIYGCTFYADQPIVISPNPNHSISIDHYNFHNMYLGALSVAFPHVGIEDGVNLTKVSFTGYQAWPGGKDGLRWIDNSSAGVSQYLLLENVRLEQGLDLANGYAIRIERNASVLQDLILRNTQIDPRQGIFLRGCHNTTIENLQYPNATGEALNVNTTCRDLEWRNCFWQTGSTANLGGLIQQWASPTTAGPLPTSARYSNISATQNQAAIPLSSAVLILTAGTVGNVYSDSFAGMLIVVSSGALVAQFSLFASSHVVVQVSAPAGGYSATAGNPGTTNVYWSGANNRYEIQNNTGGTVNYRFTFLGRGG